MTRLENQTTGCEATRSGSCGLSAQSHYGRTNPPGHRPSSSKPERFQLGFEIASIKLDRFGSTIEAALFRGLDRILCPSARAYPRRA